MNGPRNWRAFCRPTAPESQEDATANSSLSHHQHAANALWTFQLMKPASLFFSPFCCSGSARGGFATGFVKDIAGAIAFLASDGGIGLSGQVLVARGGPSGSVGV